jgi:hypothetical protein
MWTRYSKRVFLLLFIIQACCVLTCGSSLAVIIPHDFDLPIPSPDDPCSSTGKGDMKDAIIVVSEHVSILDLDVAILLTHDSFYDLQLVLESPAGTSITLIPGSNMAFFIRNRDGRFEPAGGSNRFLFDDEAAVDINEATPPFDRAFKPPSGFALSAFDGQDAYGQWCLRIEDVAFGHSGRLERVELIISSPEPTTILLFGLGAVIASGFFTTKAPRHRE